MANARNTCLAISVMARSNKLQLLDHKHTETICIKSYCVLIITNVETVRYTGVLSDNLTS
jgi:hypothetical protein